LARKKTGEVFQDIAACVCVTVKSKVSHFSQLFVRQPK